MDEELFSEIVQFNIAHSSDIPVFNQPVEVKVSIVT